MVGAGDPDGDQGPTSLELSLVGRQKWEQFKIQSDRHCGRDGYRAGRAGNAKWQGLGVNAKQGGLLEQKSQNGCPPGHRTRCTWLEEPYGWSRTSSDLGWLEVEWVVMGG